MAEKPTNGRNVKLREDGKVQEGESRNDVLIKWAEVRFSQNRSLLVKMFKE